MHLRPRTNNSMKLYDYGLLVRGHATKRNDKSIYGKHFSHSRLEDLKPYTFSCRNHGSLSLHQHGRLLADWTWHKTYIHLRLYNARNLCIVSHKLRWMAGKIELFWSITIEALQKLIPTRNVHVSEINSILNFMIKNSLSVKWTAC